MPHKTCKEVYDFDELSDTAKEKARDWYRNGHLDYDWWDGVYETVDQVATYLGINLKQKPVQLMNGKTRYDPSIYFSGFCHQGQGSSFDGTWDASKVKGKELKADFTSDKELHRLADEFTRLANEIPGMTAAIKSHRDTGIGVDVEYGEAAETRLDELEYDSPEYHAQNATDGQCGDALTEALEDFNHWIYKSLEAEYNYLNSDEQVDESIIANEYEFTQDGARA